MYAIHSVEIYSIHSIHSIHPRCSLYCYIYIFESTSSISGHISVVSRAQYVPMFSSYLSPPPPPTKKRNISNDVLIRKGPSSSIVSDDVTKNITIIRCFISAVFFPCTQPYWNGVLKKKYQSYLHCLSALFHYFKREDQIKEEGKQAKIIVMITIRRIYFCLLEDSSENDIRCNQREQLENTRNIKNEKEGKTRYSFD